MVSDPGEVNIFLHTEYVDVVFCWFQNINLLNFGDFGAQSLQLLLTACYLTVYA